MKMPARYRSARLPLPLIALSYLGFVGLGLPDGLLGVVWPSMRAFFGVPLESLGVILLTFTAGYLVTSFSSGYVLTRTGPGILLVGCSIAMAVSLLGYAVSTHWWMLVGFAGAGGLGAGALDAGLNTVAATNYSARVVNWLHACYGLGATFGPIIMTSVLVAGWRWQWVYGILAIGQVLLALSFAFTRSRWRLSSPASDTAQPARAASTIATLRLPGVWISIVLFGIYTGIEVTAGQWTFTLLTEGRAVPVSTAGTWVSVYWAALTAGRFGLGIFAGAIPVNRLLRICLTGATLGAALFWLDLPQCL